MQRQAADTFVVPVEFRNAAHRATLAAPGVERAAGAQAERALHLGVARVDQTAADHLTQCLVETLEQRATPLEKALPSTWWKLAACLAVRSTRYVADAVVLSSSRSTCRPDPRYPGVYPCCAAIEVALWWIQISAMRIVSKRYPLTCRQVR